MANIIWKFRLCPPKRESVSRWIIQIFFSTTHVATWNVFYQHLQLFIWGIRSTKWCLANFVWYLCISAFLGIPGCQAIGHGWHLLWWANQNQPCESQRCKIICRRPSSVSKFWIETIFFYSCLKQPLFTSCDLCYCLRWNVLFYNPGYYFGTYYGWSDGNINLPRIKCCSVPRVKPETFSLQF